MRSAKKADEDQIKEEGWLKRLKEAQTDGKTSLPMRKS